MSKLPLDFWTATPIKPAPMLAELGEMVLTRSESRSPKWKFRLAPDLVVQIQAKLTRALLKFHCLGVRCDRADLGDLLQPRKIDRPHWQLGFKMSATDTAVWIFKPQSCGWHRGGGVDGVVDVRDCIVAA